MHQESKMIWGGRPLSIETGKVAKQANGSALVRYGDTVVLVTVTMSEEPREGIDFFPLLIDYEERLYAVGKIPGSFIKREGRPSEKAILSARLIDRPLRPLFPKGFRHDVQVVATVLSVDQDCPPDISAMLGASLALSISDIPFEGPIGGVIVGRIDGEFVINPTQEQNESSDLHLVIAGSKKAILMVEAGAHEVSEDVMLEAIQFGHAAIKDLIAFQEKIIEQVGKSKTQIFLQELPPELLQNVNEYAKEKLNKAVRNGDKSERETAVKEIKQETLDYITEEFPEYEGKDVLEALDQILKTIVRNMITVGKIRPDGRALDEIRTISCEVGLLPRVHGSGLFTRGQTQVLTAVTLGAVGDEQLLDGLGVEESKRYLHHYNFPPYSVGETRPMRGPGRREIGHGALAERALEPIIPSEDQFPYTLRLVSEVLESNGSTSMGSVCGSTLSLMDAGVPIKAPVAGIAMGLVKEGENFSILSDIQGIEDALGDMDFKVAGTEKGITALQMDIKLPEITPEILKMALDQARAGRFFILGKMLATIPEPRAELSPYAPRILTKIIDSEKIRNVIGPAGKTIKKIIDETGVKIDIEDDGRVFIAAIDEEAGRKALEIIDCLTEDVVVGKIYKGKVVRIMDFGAFTEIIPGILGLSGKEGLIHISQLAEERVGKVRDVVKEGDEVLVKVTEIDRQGRINLSHKEALRELKKKNKKFKDGKSES